MQKSKTCFVRNGGIIYEVCTKGNEVKKDDLVVCFYNDCYAIMKVIDKPVIGEVQFTGQKGYVVTVIKDEIANLEKERSELTTSLLKLRKVLSDMYIDRVETNDESIELGKVKAEYLALKHRSDEINRKISEWKSL